MNINIKGTHIELTPAITNYVRDKLQMLEKVIEDPESAFAHAEVGKENMHHAKGDVFKAEVNLKSKGKTYYAVVVKDDLYAAIDEVKDEIMEEIKAKKDRDRSRLRRGAGHVKNFIKGLWTRKK